MKKNRFISGCFFRMKIIFLLTLTASILFVLFVTFCLKSGYFYPKYYFYGFFNRKLSNVPCIAPDKICGTWRSELLLEAKSVHFMINSQEEGPDNCLYIFCLELNLDGSYTLKYRILNSAKDLQNAELNPETTEQVAHTGKWALDPLPFYSELAKETYYYVNVLLYPTDENRSISAGVVISTGKVGSVDSYRIKCTFGTYEYTDGFWGFFFHRSGFASH